MHYIYIFSPVRYRKSSSEIQDEVSDQESIGTAPFNHSLRILFYVCEAFSSAYACLYLFYSINNVVFVLNVWSCYEYSILLSFMQHLTKYTFMAWIIYIPVLVSANLINKKRETTKIFKLIFFRTESGQ